MPPKPVSLPSAKAKPVAKSSSTSSLSVMPLKSTTTSSLSVVSAPTKPATKDEAKGKEGLSVYKSDFVKEAAKREEAKIVELISTSVKEYFGMNDQERKLKLESYLLSNDEKSRPINLRILTEIIKIAGITSFEGTLILSSMTNQINSNTDIREKGLYLFGALLKSIGRSVEPYALSLLSRLILLHVDKLATVRDLSAEYSKQLFELLCPQSFRIVFPILVSGMENENWKIKVAVLNLLKIIAPRVCNQLSPLLPQLIPKVSDCVYDSKKQVQVAALEAMNEACRAISNEDIRPLVPQLVSVIARPEESIITLDLLLETTFVATVDAPVLALIAPLLGKSLKNRSSAMKRKASRVIDIMCRLVQEPSDVAPFKDMLLPSLEKVIDELVDAEVCDVAKAARDVLLKALGEGRAALIIKPAVTSSEISEVQQQLLKTLHSVLPANNILALNGTTPGATAAEVAAAKAPLCEYIAQMCSYLVLYEAVPPPVVNNTPAVNHVDNNNNSNDNSSSSSSDSSATEADSVAAALANTAATSSASFSLPVTSTWRDLVALTLHSQWKDCTVPYLEALFNGQYSVASPRYRSSSSMGMDPQSSSSHSNSATTTTDGENEVTETFSLMNVDENTPLSGEEAAAASIAQVSAASAERVAAAFRVAALDGIPDKQTDVDADGANLCNIEFSLAFGGKILLHNTYLRLGRGRRYGVMGKNGAGKTTLLTNIGTGNIEGLPTTIKTVYVQHDDASDDGGVSLIEELMKSKEMVQAAVSQDEATAALTGIGFTEAMLTSPRSCLSGGWKMKLLIIKAMLSRADILLLDEPTNHLDTNSVQWLTNYLLSLSQVTCLIVSHDTAFLDNVLTDVIHYENKKLVYYHGNLTHFVGIHPEAKYYYELAGSTLSFAFPVPGRLDGINSTTRSILKMENVTYTYPGATQPTLKNINVKVCLGSRVAVVGANGAGKSTLIKLLVQETAPDEGTGGTIWKHMNLRVAYVAQHSFHHVEQHLDSSPVDYMKWRFHGGVDREDMARPDKKLTEEEVEERSAGERKYGDVDQVLGRRKNGRTMEYECTFIGQVVGREPNKYIPLEKMVEMGHAKLVQQCDAKTAAMAAGLDVRPLLIAEIQNHLNDFNLEAEFGTHGTIKRLSGGQKVKLVLAAAMWNKPHVIVLDEPTNYLDREALGALTQAIKSFSGGIVIISHNQEFTDAICTEKWIVKDGMCFTQGGAEEATVKAVSASMVKKSKSAPDLSDPILPSDIPTAAGNTNKSISTDIILNPRTLEALSKKQIRLLERCAAVAGVTLKDYVLKINCKSPEWKWL